MNCPKFAIALITMAGLLGQAAQAADLESSFFATPPAAEPMVELGSGWYLRGDVGYALPDNVGFRHGPSALISPKLSNAWTGDIGFGYKFNSWFRTDLTLDYRADLHLSGIRHVDNTVCTGTLLGCTIFDRTTASAAATLLNAYVDLGTWSMITPYIGAGVGATANRMAAVTSTYVNRDTGAEYSPSLNTSVAGRTSYEFAWALMAGAAIAVAPHTQIDLGYRYLNLGAFRSASSLTTPVFVTRTVQTNEFRIGVRYTID